MKTIAFIPIKLNNQRLPGKNLMDLNGRPLCDYLFQTLNNMSCFDERYVYCSDERIMPYIPSGIKFLRREPYLDGNEVKGTEIIKKFIKDVDADVYMITHVTMPFTRASSIEAALNQVMSNGYDSAYCAIKLQDYCWYQGRPVNYDMDNLVTTQNLEPIYMETGNFFVFTKEVFVNTGRRIGANPYLHTVGKFEAVDIDTSEDFEMAEAVAEYLCKRGRL